MSGMVERVAMAIHWSQWGESMKWGENYTETENCRSRARAAIEAMREPTEAMLRSAVRTEDRLDEGQVEVNYMVVAFDIWPKMIDAALKVKP